MKTKIYLLCLILSAALLSACDDNKNNIPNSPFFGTWYNIYTPNLQDINNSDNETILSSLKFDNIYFEYVDFIDNSKREPSLKGTYTTKGDIITFTVTHFHGSFQKKIMSACFNNIDSTKIYTINEVLRFSVSENYGWKSGVTDSQKTLWTKLLDSLTEPFSCSFLITTEDKDKIEDDDDEFVFNINNKNEEFSVYLYFSNSSISQEFPFALKYVFQY